MVFSKDPFAVTRDGQVPLYRRLWFVLCTLPLCAPLTILIAITGGIYMRKNGELHRVDDDTAWYLALVAFSLLIFLALNMQVGAIEV
ncbi:hypothetical protein [Pseudomonas matsuisoli]|uniref:Uncharacterized protein n=1 Tax=Pseudomonas matsuisoli TaxID=1515666 RepID=A0A917V105_9PSED|nr:hypothetical protein [Pseudomonas matsuisoli]GGK06685.1 hypothetical protein GCM10009304_36110 [Pseudomonas matsuisoli]